MSLNLTEPIEFLEDLDFNRFQEIMEKYTVIDKNRIEDELSQSPSVYAYLACVMEQAKKNMERADLNVKLADSAFRSKRRAQEGKISESRLNTEVYEDPDFYTINEEYLEKQKKYGWMRAICQAMHSKHESLIQLSSNRRAEIKLNSI
jgi:hypothetical protein